MPGSYWKKVLQRRITRRRGLAIAGSASLAAFLMACGGDDDDEAPTGSTGAATGSTGSAPTGSMGPASTGSTGSAGATSSTGATGATSSLLAAHEDTTESAKSGGVLHLSRSVDTPTFDPHNFGAPFAALNELLYSRLLNIKPGVLQAATGEVEPDIAESWEFSPDNLELTLKVRQNAAFHDVPPVNGRMLTAEDVAFSWQRVLEFGIARASVANAINPSAPIVDITALDSNTVQVRLNEPTVYILDLLTRRQVLGIAPVEAGDQLDLRDRPCGTGVMYLSDYEPSVRFEMKRHETYYDSQKAYVDQVDFPIIPEYAQGYAQLRAGNLHYYESLRGEDVLSTKNDLPDLAMYQDDVIVNTWRTLFGQLPLEDGSPSPFLDERIRQAYSMSQDRDLWIDVVYAVSDFTAAGIPVETRWNTALVADVFQGWWLDPKSDAFGENAKYFEYNLEEAKALLSAAGYPDGVAVPSHIAATGFGPEAPRLIEALEGFAEEAGFHITPNLIDYNTEYVPNIRDSEGQFVGIGYKTGPAAPAAEASARLIYDYHSKSAVSRYGYDVNGVGDNSGDPHVDELLDRAKGEFDDAARMEIVHELQRYLGKTQYATRLPGGASRLMLVWPAVKNYNVFRSDQPTRLSNKTWWLDQTLPPFA